MTAAPSARTVTAPAPAPQQALDRALVLQFLAGQAAMEELPAPRWGPIGREVYERTYSRDIPTADGSIRKETWAETARRVVLGNTGFAPPDSLLPEEAAELFELIFAFKAIPAGRHLWVTGTQNPFSRNCWCSGFSARTSDHFAYLASRLFEGGGVGSNYSHDLLALTCPVRDQLRVAITCSPEHVDFEQVRSCSGDLWAEPGSDLPGHATLHRTDDSREGWVATWVEMIDLACTPGDHTLLIDLSDVREFGAPLKTFGGTASGPGPLATAISGITRVLSGAAGRRLTGLESMTIDQEIAASVVAGGTRRSARMSMMVWDDPQVFEFISCKASWTEHWTTNISVEVDDRFHAALAAGDRHAGRVLTAVATRMAADGEPGLVDSSAHSIGEPIPIRVTNPCLTGDTKMLTRDGLQNIADLAGLNFEVWNGQRWSRSTAWSTGVKDAYLVQLSDGRRIKATANHVFATADGREVQAADLVGEKIAFFAGQGWQGGSDPFTERDALLLGFLQGDGSKRPDCGAISTKNNEPEMADILREYGFKKVGNDWYAGAQSEAAALVEKAQMLDEHLPQRGLPTWLFTASQATVAVFLRGLYSANGSSLTTVPRVTLKSTCRDMVGDVQMLLGAMGMRSYITTNKATNITWHNGTFTSQESYDLNVTAYPHLLKFGHLIGFIHSHKNASLESYSEPRRRSYLRAATVVALTPIGQVEVFDFNEPQRHWGWANGLQAHNCSEIGLQFDTLDAAGESCNIGSVDLAAFGTDHLGASRAFRLMARFLLRATLNPYPGEAPGRIERRNRRIGVGIMGLQGWLAAHGAKMTEFAGDQGLREVMTGFRLATRSSADTLADTLGIPRPVKVTAVAPTGSIAQLGGTGAGIHPAFARFFIRRVRYSCSDPKLDELAATGYTIVDDVYAANTKVVEFPQQELLAARYGELIEQADEISAADFLAMQLAVQLSLCGGADGNAVSSTGAIPEGMDPAELETAMRSVLGQGIKGITCFPEASGRALTPYERITQQQFEAMSAALFDAELASLTGDSNSGECAGGACPIR